MTAADGRAVEFTDTRANATYLAPEARVEVLYPPGRPYAGRIYTPLDYWLAASILLGVGVPMSAIGVALIGRRRAAPRRRREEVKPSEATAGHTCRRSRALQ